MNGQLNRGHPSRVSPQYTTQHTGPSKSKAKNKSEKAFIQVRKNLGTPLAVSRPGQNVHIVPFTNHPIISWRQPGRDLDILLLTYVGEEEQGVEYREQQDGSQDHGAVHDEEEGFVLHEVVAPAHLLFWDTIAKEGC